MGKKLYKGSLFFTKTLLSKWHLKKSLNKAFGRKWVHEFAVEHRSYAVGFYYGV
jgi:hypothetical protein